MVAAMSNNGAPPCPSAARTAFAFASPHGRATCPDPLANKSSCRRSVVVREKHHPLEAFHSQPTGRCDGRRCRILVPVHFKGDSQSYKLLLKKEKAHEMDANYVQWNFMDSK